MVWFKKAAAALIALGLPIAAAAPAQAEVSTLRMSIQPSFAFLQLYVLQHEHYIEKAAADLGIADLKVEWPQLSGDAAVNDALLSGAVDVVCGGAPGFLSLWDKTWQTPQEVRAVTAMGHFDLLLNTRLDRVQSIKDFTPTDRIAMAAVKVSAQALLLEMAAAKEWGPENYDRLDDLTFALSPPDQTTGMLSGNLDSAFGSPPFSILQLNDPSVHTILKATDLVGEATSSLLWTTKKFHDDNPTVYKALIQGMQEAQKFIDSDLSKAIDIYIEATQNKLLTNEEMTKMLSAPGYGFDIVPHGFMIYSEFMSSVGRLKNKPESWKDQFFSDIHEWGGS